jgi:hypothetical protein
MPGEFTRVDGLTYSLFAIEALCNLAYLGDLAGVDLWNYRTPMGSGIRKTIDWMLPYATGIKTWNYNQLTDDTNYDAMVSTFRIVGNAYQTKVYETALSNIVDVDAEKLRVNLFWPSTITNATVSNSSIRLNQVQINLKVGQRILSINGFLKSLGNTNYSVRYSYRENGLTDWKVVPDSQLQGISATFLSGNQFTNDWVLPKTFNFEKKYDIRTDVLSSDGSTDNLTHNAVSVSELYQSGSDYKNIVCLNNPCSQNSEEGMVIINLPALQKAGVYRVTGMLVQELAINNLTGRIHWNLRDNSNKRISAGVFLIQLSGVGGQAITKLVVTP